MKICFLVAVLSEWSFQTPEKLPKCNCPHFCYSISLPLLELYRPTASQQPFPSYRNQKMGVIPCNLLWIFCQPAQILRSVRLFSVWASNQACYRSPWLLRENVAQTAGESQLLVCVYSKLLSEKHPDSSVKETCWAWRERRGLRRSQAFVMHCLEWHWGHSHIVCWSL